MDGYGGRRIPRNPAGLVGVRYALGLQPPWLPIIALAMLDAG